jgi:hypothetical protein
MKTGRAWVAWLLLSACASAQAWRPFLEADRAIDWSGAGVGHIPERAGLCARLTPSATTAQINAALASCPAEQAVFLAAGTYEIDGNIRVPSRVTLRGAGAGRTILNATGVLGGAVITLGGGSAPFHPVKIVGGGSAGSTRLLLPHGESIDSQFLVIAETNDPAFVSSGGIEGNCNWCDGDWTKTGDLARGQIVEATAVVNGTTVVFRPALYGAYTHSPVAVPITMAGYAGVEDLEVRANKSGYEANFSMAACAWCWIKGVESNYADGEHVAVTWGFHDEVRDSYFSNEFLHRAGERDADIQLALKTTASLVENNIIERGHQSVMLEWGAAGNVIAYNYMTGAFDRDTPNLVIGGIDFHGAHPQFNLVEGNVAPNMYADPFWGTSSGTTAFRNWLVGTTRVCSPLAGRHAVDCAGARYAYQAARPVQVSYLSTRNNFVGNVLGSAAMQTLAHNGRRLAQIASAGYPGPRSYDGAAYGWTFGYGGDGDDGSGSGCSGGGPVCHGDAASLDTFLHGNYNNADRAVDWAGAKAHTLPASFYLGARPAWWGSMPFPATGSDVTGGSGPGGHSYGNPAQACYLKVMRGADGGAGSPLAFDPDACYGNTTVAR